MLPKVQVMPVWEAQACNERKQVLLWSHEGCLEFQEDTWLVYQWTPHIGES